MSDNTSEEEPSIEEILASIRQIISDDDEEVKEGDSEEPVEEVIENPVHEESTNDVLELTEEEMVEVEPDLEEDPVEDIIEPEPEVEEEPEDTPMEVEMRDRLEEIRAAVQDEPEIEEESDMPTKDTVPSDILSSNTQSAAIGSIAKLASKMPINSPRSYDGVTLEDIVREMLHPMLREWMDDNLPTMVERIVQKELEKLARRAMDD